MHEFRLTHLTQSTSRYIPNFVQIGKNFRARTDMRTDGQTLRPALLGRIGEIDLKTS